MRTPRITIFCFLLLVAIATLVDLAAWRRFRDLDPRFDQAGNALIARQLAESTHVFPRVQGPGPAGFALRLEADRTALLRPLARTYRVEPIVMLDATSLLLNACAMRLSGITYSVTIVASIVASSLTALVVFAWCFALLPQLAAVPRSLSSALAGAVLLLGSYHFYFSPWGAHNFAVFFWTLTLYAADLALRRWSRGEKSMQPAFALAAAAGALYSYSANLLLLLLTLPLAIVLLPRPAFKKRLAAAAAFTGFVAAATFPVLLTFFPPPLAGLPDPHPAVTAWHSALGWFAAGAGYYSLPGFLLGLAGVVLLAAGRRSNVAALALGAHFLLWTCLRSFTWNMTATGLRTFNYILPLFALGAGITAGLAWQKRARPRLAVGVVAAMLLVHVGSQLRLMRDQPLFARRIPLFASLFFFEQGSVHAWVRAVDAGVPQGAGLLTGDAEIADSFEVLTTRNDLATQELPTLEALQRHQESGDLAAYLSIRRKQSIPCSGLYVIAGAGAEEQIARVLRGAATGCAGSRIGVEALQNFGFPSDHRSIRQIVLYRVAAG